jgi:ribonucrease Y
MGTYSSIKQLNHKGDNMDWLGIVISSILGLIVGGLAGFIIRVAVVEKGFQTARNKSQSIIDNAFSQAEKLKKEKLLDAKQEIHNLNLENDKLLKEKRATVTVLENKMHQREELLERRSANLDKREVNLDRKEEVLDNKKTALEEKNQTLENIIKEQNDKLFEIANFSVEQAQEVIMNRVKEEMVVEVDN